jgi:hypothetical protein
MIAPRNSSQSKPLIRPRNVENRGIAPASIVSEQYHERFCFAHTRPIFTLPQVEALLDDIADQEIETSLSGIRLLGAANSPSDGKDPARITNGEDPGCSNGGEPTISTGIMTIYQPSAQTHTPTSPHSTILALPRSNQHVSPHFHCTPFNTFHRKRILT